MEIGNRQRDLLADGLGQRLAFEDREAKDRQAGARATQGDGLLDGGHADGADLGQILDGLDRRLLAVAVGVLLGRNDDASALGQTARNALDVAAEGGEVDLDPGTAPGLGLGAGALGAVARFLIFGFLID